MSLACSTPQVHVRVGSSGSRPYEWHPVTQRPFRTSFFSASSISRSPLGGRPSGPAPSTPAQKFIATRAASAPRFIGNGSGVCWALSCCWVMVWPPGVTISKR